MIILLEAAPMIINRLELKGLHGIYNYNVAFREDLTFIYGENGCGKTTILDIVSSIVTGRLYNLFRYKFDELTLSYRENKREHLNRIRIKSLGNSIELFLNENQMHEIIDAPRKIGEVYSRDEDDYTFDRRFMASYEFPHFLRRTFNYIYLPLSRNSQDGIDIIDMPYRRHRALTFPDRDFANKNYLNESLRYVEDIIRTGCMRISSAENMASEQFKNSIFTSSLKVTNEYSFTKLLTSIKSKETLDGIEQNQREYIKTLKSIGEWNSETEKRLKDFFEKYKSAFRKAQQEDSEGHPSLSVDLLVMNIEFNRIKDIATQAQMLGKSKEKIRTPISSSKSANISFSKMSAMLSPSFLYRGSTIKTRPPISYRWGSPAIYSFSMPAPPFQHGHKNYIMPWRDAKQKNYFP